MPLLTLRRQLQLSKEGAISPTQKVVMLVRKRPGRVTRRGKRVKGG